jgi:ketose-bisphosphate aldolase
MKSASEIYDIPVCIHLDHATDITDIKNAIDAGFTSVMYDGSVLSYEENAKNTKEVVEYAHKFGVSVEAELGHVTDAIAGTGESLITGTTDKDVEDCLTDVSEVVKFVEYTNVDCLAVAIGTAHGVYVSTPVLQFDRLDEINKVSKCPLVLQGGSGTPDDDEKKVISLGITKINIFSEVLNALNTDLRDKLTTIENMAMWPIFVNEKGVLQMKEVIRHKIRTFGSNNRG